MNATEKNLVEELKKILEGKEKIYVNKFDMIQSVGGRILISYRGNLIMAIRKFDVQMFSCGWKTKTTKSRLNAYLSLFDLQVKQKNNEWTVHDARGRWDFVEGLKIAYGFYSFADNMSDAYLVVNDEKIYLKF